MNYQQIKETLHVSYSQLRSFLICPMKYFYGYVLGLEWESVPSALVLGSATHRAIEEMYRVLVETGELITDAEMTQVFLEHLGIETAEKKIIFRNGQTLESVTECGKGLIKVFRENVQPQQILKIEEPFMVPIPDCDYALAGVFDLIESDNETPVLVELKTSAKSWSDYTIKDDLQSALYTYAMQEMGYESGLVRFDILVKNQKPKLQQLHIAREKRDIDRALLILKGVIDAVEKEAFYRNPSWACLDCQFKKQCHKEVIDQ